MNGLCHQVLGLPAIVVEHSSGIWRSMSEVGFAIRGLELKLQWNLTFANTNVAHFFLKEIGLSTKLNLLWGFRFRSFCFRIFLSFALFVFSLLTRSSYFRSFVFFVFTFVVVIRPFWHSLFLVSPFLTLSLFSIFWLGIHTKMKQRVKILQ